MRHMNVLPEEGAVTSMPKQRAERLKMQEQNKKLTDRDEHKGELTERNEETTNNALDLRHQEKSKNSCRLQCRSLLRKKEE